MLSIHVWKTYMYEMELTSSRSSQDENIILTILIVFFSFKMVKVARLIDFNVMSSLLWLIYAQSLGNRGHCTFISTFLCSSFLDFFYIQ